MTKMAALKQLRILSVALALVLAGCNTIQPIKNISNAPVTSSKTDPTLDEVREAIKRAGIALGWGMKETSPGNIVATLILRTHTAVVQIKYDTKAYSIEYSDSTDLKYDATKQVIHRNYNGWVQNLNNAIRTSFVNLQ